MSLVAPNRVPLLGGPVEKKAPIGGVELTFFEDPRQGIGIHSQGVTPELVAHFLTANNVFINALCREVVALREENAALAKRVGEIEMALQSGDEA